MRVLVHICMTLAVLAGLMVPMAVVSQTTRVGFTWVDRSEQVLAGSVEARLTSRQGPGRYEVEFRVTWYDASGRPIPETSSRPLLYLSQYALDLLPAGAWKCSSFSGPGAAEVAFSESARLGIEAIGQTAGTLEVQCGFQYALNEDQYRKGSLEKIRLPDGKTANFRFVLPSQPIGANLSDAGGKLPVREQLANPGAALYRILMAQFENYQNQLNDLQRRKENENISKKLLQVSQETDQEVQRAAMEEVVHLTQLFLADMDYFISGFNSVRPANLADSLPLDSARAITNRFDRLSDLALSLRSEYNQYNIMARAFQPGADVASRTGIADSLRRSAKRTYSALFIAHHDTLGRFTTRLDSLRGEITPAMRKRSAREREANRLATQQKELETIRADFNRLKLLHQQTLVDYRSLTFGLGTIQEVESLHQDYSSRQVATENSLNETDNLLKEYMARISDPFVPSNDWLIWVAAIVAALVILMAGLRLLRPRKGQLPQQEGPLKAFQQGAQPGNGMRAGLEPPLNYYTADFVHTIGDVVIGRIHVSPAAITAVYQLLHGAFMEKRAGSFGGYLLGSSYKLNVDGASKFELVIEKVAASALIRPESPNTMEFRQELVDEMDKLIRENRKVTLLGWFTSCSDPALEMNEGLQKIHRTFFDQRSQIALLVNAGSEELNTACFLRRKTGYFDPIPDPGAFLKWETLYRFSQSPVVIPGEIQKSKPSFEFVPLALDQGWCDSLVDRVNLEKGALSEMRHASSILSSPSESYQVVGYLYGSVHVAFPEGQGIQGFSVAVERFVEISNEMTPRAIPGLTLLGWFGQGKSDIFSYISAAVNYHDQYFKEPYQVACLLNSHTMEFRVFSRKQNLAMNDNSIDTEEFNFETLTGNSR